jgi:hypothetical protein
MERFGPQYCETPGSYSGFPIEPWNVWSSAVIVLYGLAAIVLVRRRAPASWLLYLACLFLVVNGAGSMLWHGLRTRWSLTLDFLPAFLFVGLVAVLWARRVAPMWQGLLILAILFGAQFLPRDLLEALGLGQLGWIMVRALSVTVCALWLIGLTFRVSVTAAATGAAALALAIVALAMRSLDAVACEQVGFGSHFLWHVFLSTAAYLAMRVLVALEPQPGHQPPNLVMSNA